MRYTKLWETTVLQLLFTLLILMIGWFLPNEGLKVFVLSLTTLSWLWAIQRIWRYQPSTEIEKRVQLTKLKLGCSLWLVGLASLNLYFVIDQIVGVDTIYTLYLLFLPGIGLLAALIGCILLIQGRKLNPVEP
jgi:hypothetical protein